MAPCGSPWLPVALRLRGDFLPPGRAPELRVGVLTPGWGLRAVPPGQTLGSARYRAAVLSPDLPLRPQVTRSQRPLCVVAVRGAKQPLGEESLLRDVWGCAVGAGGCTPSAQMRELGGAHLQALTAWPLPEGPGQ